VPPSGSRSRWGATPWEVDVPVSPSALPGAADFCVVGGGFAGLTAAAWLRRLQPGRSVVLLESAGIGSGASGHTGGLALAESAAGDLPGLGDVLHGFTETLHALGVECEQALPGVWELGREGGLADSPIRWNDSGELRAVGLVPGGTIHPGKMVAGLAQAAHSLGAQLFDHVPVERIEPGLPPRVHVAGKVLQAGAVLLATNAMSLELSGLAGRAQSKFTLAVATAPLLGQQLGAIGLAEGKGFYTVDLPYLWGRTLRDGTVVFGSGLVHPRDSRELEELDVGSGECAKLIARLEERIRGLHPALGAVEFTRRWGGPILIASGYCPVLARHSESSQVIVLGGFSGHGVALSVYLGRWAAEVLLERRSLPEWGSAGGVI